MTSPIIAPHQPVTGWWGYTLAYTTPTGIATSEAFGAPTIRPLAVQPGIGSAETFGAPHVTTGAVTVTANGIGSTETVGAPAFTRILITATGIPSTETVGKPALTQLPAPFGIPSAETVGASIVAQPSLITLSPVGIPSTETSGAPKIINVAKPAGVPSAETSGAPKIAKVATLIGIASAETAGASSVSSIIAPAFDNAASATQMTGATTATWYMTATAGSYVLLPVAWYGSSGTISATYGSSSMTLLMTSYPWEANHYLGLLGLAGAPSGTQTVTLTTSGAHGQAGTISYNNVASVSAVTTVNGTANPLTQSVSCSGSQMIVQMFTALNNYVPGGMTGGINRIAGISSIPQWLEVNESAASTTFQTNAASSGNWGSMDIILTG